MSIMELGAIGEFVGAIAVVLTLIYLTIQVRQSREAMEENSRLARTSAMEHQSDVVSRWRGRLINDADVATLWQKAVDGEVVDEITAIRIQNLLIDWFNTYRSYFLRARAVGHDGLAEQAVASLAMPLVRIPRLVPRWRKDPAATHAIPRSRLAARAKCTAGARTPGDPPARRSPGTAPSPGTTPADLELNVGSPGSGPR